MKVAVEGCCHGELDKIYETIAFLEKEQNFKVDLLLCCGDFQAVRNPSDLRCMAVPPKFQKMNTFYKYYSGEKIAPILTIFIGGNHEASNYLQELPYGGWVAPNIYYLGNAGVVQIGGIRIGGLSGIFKGRDYQRGRYEHLPYTEESKRSVYHVRNIDVFRLKQSTRPMDIFLSHDWPASVYKHGNYQQLARFKPYFADEMENNTLGSPPAWEVLNHIKPAYWFSAHLHAKFAAIVQHEGERQTRFLALDKCLPKRRFLQLLDIPHDTSKGLKLQLDPEWLNILKSTNHLLNTSNGRVYMPGPGSKERYDFTVTDEDIDDIQKDFGGEMTIPTNFEHLVDPYYISQGPANAQKAPPARICINNQTTLLCQMLDITDPNTYFTESKPSLQVSISNTSNPAEIQVNSSSNDEDSDAEATETTYDTFVISQDESSAALSTSKIEDSFDDEKFVTALASLSESSVLEKSQEEESAISGVAEMSATSEDGGASPPLGLLSPPTTSSDEQVGSSSEKDSSAYLSPAPQKSENSSPKRPLVTEPDSSTDPAQALFTDSPAVAPESRPKKFKRRNQSIYATPDLN